MKPGLIWEDISCLVLGQRHSDFHIIVKVVIYPAVKHQARGNAGFGHRALELSAVLVPPLLASNH